MREPSPWLFMVVGAPKKTNGKRTVRESALASSQLQVPSAGRLCFFGRTYPQRRRRPFYICRPRWALPKKRKEEARKVEWHFSFSGTTRLDLTAPVLALGRGGWGSLECTATRENSVPPEIRASQWRCGKGRKKKNMETAGYSLLPVVKWRAGRKVGFLWCHRLLSKPAFLSGAP